MTRKPMELRGPSEPSTDLRDRVADSAMGEALPLVHVTEVGIGNEIIFSGQLQARQCKVFGRKLLYFFLGRPAYRLHDEAETSRYISRYPCVFVVDPKRVKPVQVYPFDTGAARAGFYDSADPHLGIKDYLLDGTYESARQQLGFAFESVEDYFEGHLKPGLTDDVPHFEQATHSYVSIANQANRGINDPGTYDDRASAIEIASEDHLSLKGAVELVIMPQQYLEGETGKKNDKLIERLKALGINIAPYDWQSTRSPADFRAEINAKVLAHFRDRVKS
ncbi:hypothetical protein [Rhizobium sp. 2MFCol3.1]|uniref:hypothetical protein n=1 Tax=Rhizobium sp. 2MFCol3.1 TaxID=1246459 RepID=UPI000381C3F9|nr:hypothetical protein [Rhizobium sp. 2MFCol3.1]